MSDLASSRTRCRGDDGFTLIELIIVMVIMPLVTGAIAVALIASFDDQGNVSNRLTDSHDAQIVSTYFVRDVQDATTVSYASTGTLQCAPSGTTGTQILGLQWTPPGGVLTTVSYVDTTLGTSQALIRYSCQGSSTTPVDTSTLAHDISPTAPTVTRTCSTTSGTCYFTLAVTELKTNYQYSVLASPRSGARSSVLPPGVATLLLGGNFTFTNGAFVVNGGGALVLNGAMITLNNGSITANPIYTDRNLPSNACSGHCTPPNLNGTLTTSPDYPDPLAGLPVPTSTTQYTGSVSTSGQTLSPGEYQQSVAFGGTVAFNPGVYIFDAGFTVNNATLQNASGGGGVLFYVKSGSATASSGTIDLDAATSGPYAGLFYWQSKLDSSQFSINNTNVSSNGGVYAPTAPVNMASGQMTFAGLYAYALVINDGSGQVSVGPG